MKLKPCPFCGATAEVKTTPVGFMKVRYYVRCNGCGVSFCGSKLNRFEAVETWNSRVKDTPL